MAHIRSYNTKERVCTTGTISRSTEPTVVNEMASPNNSEKITTVTSRHGDEEQHGTTTEFIDLTVLGYKPELQRNRSMFTLLFQSLAIAAVSANYTMRSNHM